MLTATITTQMKKMLKRKNNVSIGNNKTKMETKIKANTPRYPDLGGPGKSAEEWPPVSANKHGGVFMTVKYVNHP